MSEPGPLPLEVDCLTVKRLLEMQDDFLLLDCREREEHQLAAIEGAALIPMSELMARAVELEEHRGKRVAVHCHHGGRSLRVASWLREHGFPTAQSMAGGIDQWAVDIDPKVARY